MLLYVDARLATAPWVRVTVMLVGWLVVYVCCHSLAHYIVGRLGGIRFRSYGLRGIDGEEFPGVRLVALYAPEAGLVLAQAGGQDQGGASADGRSTH